MWQWLNFWRVEDALRDADDTVVDVIADALDLVLFAPYEPPGLQVHTFPDRPNQPEKHIAWLPRGYFLTYRPYLNGPPPYAGPHVVVLAMSRYDDLEEWPPPEQ